MQRLLIACACFQLHAHATETKRPNFVWLHVESTDGRTYLDDMADVVPIPNIRSLKNRGAHFVNTYANIPICCPSRASMWAGRHAHNMPHEHNGMSVGGAYNNYEGFGVANSTFDHLKISDRLAEHNYTIKVGGKEDWLSGSHSLTTMVDSFSIYARWPYNIPEEGGFHIWGDCGGNVTVNPGNESAHRGDWKVLEEQVAWLRDTESVDGASASQPFFLHQGMNIVHPPYHTDEMHLNRIPMDKVLAPAWPPLESFHPCDMQVSMKKGCARPGLELNTTEHKKQVRAVYYAMIAEFDDMVGEYIKAVEDAGLRENTVIIVSSDHGDMQMEHAQFYKMVAYEGSTRVPVVMAGPGVNHIGDGNIHTLVSLIDLLPTFLDLAAIPLPASTIERPDDVTSIDGTSLVPLLQQGDAASASHPDAVVSQFHGENLAMSWYMIRRGEMKYVVWGTGAQHEPQLFNLTADPNEWHNLALATTSSGRQESNQEYQELIDDLDAALRQVVNYPKVTKEVAQYNLNMGRWWVAHEPHWRGVLNGTANGSVSHPPGWVLTSKTMSHFQLNADWGELWAEWPEGYLDAWNSWLGNSNAPKYEDSDALDAVAIPPCPSDLIHGWKK